MRTRITSTADATAADATVRPARIVPALVSPHVVAQVVWRLEDATSRLDLGHWPGALAGDTAQCVVRAD